jgi:hypothetical protein
MYQWYNKSEVCYVYLSDVTKVPTDYNYSQFWRSKWFIRGWTLQELIAPKTVIFYDCSWRDIGTRRSLEKLLSVATGIKHEHFQRPGDVSVAQRMSWASRRQTTRVEDQAYSLLAPYPADFIGSGDIIRAEGDNPRPPYHMTSRGLQIEVFLLPTDETSAYLQYTVPLHCVKEYDNTLIGITISDITLDTNIGTSNFATDALRRDGDLVLVTTQELPSQMTLIYVKQSNVRGRSFWNDISAWGDLKYGTTFALTIDSLLQSNFTIFRELWLNCPHQPIPVQRVSDY